MIFTIQCTFAPGAFAHAKRLRLEHYAFLRNAKASIIEGGPLLGTDDLPVGMLMVVEQPDADSVKAFIAQEPYNANRFFESVQIRKWSLVIPEPTLDFIEHEYQKELKLRKES